MVLHKPDSVVLPEGSIAVIYLGLTSQRGSICLPADLSLKALRASHPRRSAYWAFQYARFAPSGCCQQLPCALTALFHPYPACARRLFSVALSINARLHCPPVRWCIALYCPDFPLQACSLQRQPSNHFSAANLPNYLRYVLPKKIRLVAGFFL